MAGIKLKASSLVETIVAATIITLVTGLGMSIFVMVSSPASSSRSLLTAQQKSGEILDTISPESIRKLENIEYYQNGLEYFVEIEELSLDLFNLSLEVQDTKGRIFYTRNRIFKVDER